MRRSAIAFGCSARALALSVVLLVPGTSLLAQPARPATQTTLSAFHSADGPDPERWYHVNEFDGPDAAVIRAVYERIEKIDGPRRDPKRLDTIVAYGPGHWVFEWEKEGEDALARARAAQAAGDKAAAENAYFQAARLFAIGSSPHLRSDAHAMRALDKARVAYRAAAALSPGQFRVLSIPHEGKSFEAYLHLPPGKGPFPVLVASNGSDFVKEQGGGALIRGELDRRDIALLVLDLPGIGGSGAYNLTPESEALHVAAIAFIRKDPAVDPNRVAVMGSSFGGHAAARLLFHPELRLAGVIAACGPLHTGFSLPARAYDRLPPLTMDGVRDRVGVAIGSPAADLAAKLRPFSLKTNPPAAAATGKMSTPLLILATDDDPVAPLADLPLLQGAASSVTTFISHEQGHCPNPSFAHPAAAAWLTDVFAAAGPR